MRHVLHLIKDPVNRVALDVLTRQAADPELRLSVVLLHNATSLSDPLPGQVFRLDGYETTDATSPYPRITHAQLLDLIFLADTVVTW
jgi:hypothetical protein